MTTKLLSFLFYSVILLYIIPGSFKIQLLLVVEVGGCVCVTQLNASLPVFVELTLKCLRCMFTERHLFRSAEKVLFKKGHDYITIKVKLVF